MYSNRPAVSNVFVRNGERVNPQKRKSGQFKWFVYDYYFLSDDILVLVCLCIAVD